MALRIVSDENIPAVEHYLGPLANVRRIGGREITPRHLHDTDALLVRSVTPVDADLLEGSSVRFVGTTTSGTDHIDLEYLRRHGIGFAHAPGANANSVVEYVLAAVAEVGERLEHLLQGGTVGVVGYGVIGSAVAARFSALGIRCRVYDPWLDQRAIPEPAALADVLSCDLVTLHPELTLERPWPSFHLLAQPELAQLGRDCLLINASRGAVVDNSALHARLTEGDGPACVLDVWEGEPFIDQALLKRVDLGTAHIAGYSLDGKLLGTQMVCQALASHFEIDVQVADSPAGEPEPLELPDGLAGAALIRYLLRARYGIRDDHQRLREATLGAEPGPAAAAFDRLRRDYPARRELLGSAVRGRFSEEGVVALLEGLGCIPFAAGEAE